MEEFNLEAVIEVMRATHPKYDEEDGPAYEERLRWLAYMVEEHPQMVTEAQPDEAQPEAQPTNQPQPVVEAQQYKSAPEAEVAPQQVPEAWSDTGEESEVEVSE
ncbi:MAG TPA: hypothetical protein VF043_07730 [Ktedonobacteraceae bacterium]